MKNSLAWPGAQLENPRVKPRRSWMPVVLISVVAALCIGTLTVTLREGGLGSGARQVLAISIGVALIAVAVLVTERLKG